MFDDVTILLSSAIAASAAAILGAVYARCIVRVPPNRALVLYGRKAPRFQPDRGLGPSEVAVHRARIVVGGRVFLPPWNKGVEQLSLDPVSVDVSVRSLQAGGNGKATGWEILLRVQAKIPAEPAALTAAAENLLHRTEDEVRASVRRSIEGVVPSVLSRLKPDEGAPDWDRLGVEIQAAAASELVVSGLIVQSLSITELRPILPSAGAANADRPSRGPAPPALPAPAAEASGVGRLESRLARSERDLRTLGAAVARLYREFTDSEMSLSGASVLDAPLGIEFRDSVVFAGPSEPSSHDSTVGISALAARGVPREGNDEREPGRDPPLE